MGASHSGVNIFAGIPPMPEGSTGRAFCLGNSTTYVPGGVAGSDTAGAHGDTPYRPFATLDYAVSQCTANRGDYIYVLPGHAETIATATALALDVAGITVIGLGSGNTRPTFTVNGVAGATITVSAANVTWKNCLVIAGLDGLDSTITVTGADCTLDLEHRDTSATVEADIAITASGARLTCTLKDVGFSTGDQREASISMNGVVGARIDIDQYGLVNTAVVNFVTTLCSNVEVRGTTRTSVTDGSRNVVDTITGSLWYMDVIDAAAGSRYTGGSAAAVASDDISAVNTVLGTVATAAATGAVTATDTIMAYLKQLVTQTGIELDTNTLGAILYGTGGIATFPAAAIPGDAVSLAEVIRQLYAALEGTAASQNGVATWPTAAAYANNVSIAEVLGYVQDGVRRGTGTTLPANTSLADYAEAVSTTAAAVIANGTATIFTVAGGPIEVQNIMSVCVTANDGTATTLKYTADPTDGTATDLCAASASLASATAGTIVNITGTLANAAVVTAQGTAIAQAGRVVVPAGVIQAITATGPTTGTWTHHLRYKPLAKGVTVT